MSNLDGRDLRVEDLNPVAIRARVAMALREESMIVEIAQRSYVHANGFFKIVLDDGDVKRRLHYWKANQEFEENIHTHRWHLVSRILHGVMRERKWKVIEGNTHEIFGSSPRTGSQVEVKKVENSLCGVELFQFRQFEPGDVYECAEGEFHQTVISKSVEPVLTACLTYAPNAPYALVAKPVDSTEEEYTLPSAALTTDQLRNILTEIYYLISLGKPLYSLADETA